MFDHPERRGGPASASTSATAWATGSGSDLHERPVLSSEDENTARGRHDFTDEPSIIARGSFGVRIENIVVCAEGGADVLDDYPNDLGTNP